MINWEIAYNFKKEEFPEDPDKYADSVVIYALQQIRTFLGTYIYPSPAKGALARFDFEDRHSQHYCNLDQGIHSKAVDWFTEGDPKTTFLTLISLRYNFRPGAFGIYLDTQYHGKCWPMFHIDIRTIKDLSLPTMWYREKGKYYYIQHKVDFNILLNALDEARDIHNSRR